MHQTKKLCSAVSLRSSQVAHQAGAYSRFLKHEATRSISTPPGWDASASCSAVLFSKNPC